MRILGAVWIFVRSAGVWSQQGNKLVGTGAIGNDFQGQSVAISADGNTALFGGNGDNSNAGAAWIFTRSGTTWTQQGSKLIGTSAIGSAQQGRSVSLSADGNTALIGGFNDNGGIGAIWIFTRSGTTWSQQGSKLVGTGYGLSSNEGTSVSLSADGNTAVVGGSNDGLGIGATWIFTRTDSSWSQQGSKLVGTGYNRTSFQGVSVSASADGNTVLVGGSGDASNMGATWVFTRSGSSWVQQGNKLVGTYAISMCGQGFSVSLSADGNTAMLGSIYDTNQIGAVWSFTRSGSTWTQKGSKLVGIGYSGTAAQGYSIALSSDGNTALSGGPNDNTSIGAIWAFISVPEIVSQSTASQTKCINDPFSAITVSASGANLAYQWYSIATATNSGGTSLGTVNGAQTSSYTPQATATGSTFYYCVVSGTGGTTTSSASGAFIVYPLKAIISQSTASQNCILNGAFTAITVTASGTGLTYQWYSNSIAENNGGTPLGSANGAQNSSYTPQSTTAGTNYYYCVVTGCGIDTSTVSGAVNTVISVPVITSFTPSMGPVGTLVTITGTNLDNPALSIGGAVAIVVSGNSTTLVGMVMPGAVTGTISVTAGGATGTGGTNFTVAPTPYPTVQQGEKLVGTGATVAASLQGYSISLSADGNTAIVGGPVNTTAGSGSIWIYTRTGGVWTQQGNKLPVSGSSAQGIAVALSADGNTALVGGPSYTLSSKTYLGTIWLFTRSGSTWTLQGTSNGSGIRNCFYGCSVSLSADGNTAIVGERGTNGAWILTRSAGVWTRLATKLTGTGGIGTSQGQYVSISANGNTAIVACPTDNTNVGAAWVFSRSGSTWSQQGDKLVGAGAIGAAMQGRSVSLSADGNTALVGGSADNTNIGATWVFTRSGTTWSQQGDKLVGTGAVGAASQGVSVALSADGDIALTGGYLDNANTGAIWVFTRSGTTWTQQGTKLIGTGSVGNAAQGNSIALSADGNTAMSGGYIDNTSIGAAWAFIAAPTIISQSTATQTICLNGDFGNISVISTGNNLTYQWYSSTTAANTGGISLETANGAQTASYTPQATTVGTKYYYCVLNGDGGTPQTSAVSGAMITYLFSAPTTQASALFFTDILGTQMTIGWSSGNGANRAVFVKMADTGTTAPVDATTYTANSIFSTGTQIDATGWYCVYNGTATSVTVTGLTAGTSYIVQVFEYNGNTGSELYNTATAQDNPKSGTTSCINPTGGGTIGSDQTICQGSSPVTLTSIAAPTGHTGTLEYKWQLSTTSSSSGFSDIEAGNT
ncbi:MAG: hypothetical protein WCJ95_15630 [Mariniphaga sp.]